MQIKKSTAILFLSGCVVLLALIYCATTIPGFLPGIIAVKSTTVPTYPSENISTVVKTPRGSMIINASVPESLAIMPVYRLNMSDRRTMIINRIPMSSELSQNNGKNPLTATTLIPETEAKPIAEKFLRTYHGLPDDTTVWKVVEHEHPWGGQTPEELRPYELSTPYTRIIYTRMLNGIPVDNWGINHEEFSPGEYGNMETDHDFIVVGLRPDGDMAFITERWTKSEYIQDEPVISAGEALDRARLWEYTREDYGSIKNLQVRMIRQGYFEATGHTSIIEPAWFFSGPNEDGYNQTVVVLARKNDSAVLSFYNYTHPDPSLPDEWADRHKYESWIRENYINGTISIEKATDIVKKFSGNPNLVIENTIPFYEESGCKYTIFPRIPLYNITTNEGTYTIDSHIFVVRSVSYPVNVTHTLANPVEYPQILKISSDYIREKFGRDSAEDLERNPRFTENPGTYQMVIPVQNATILLDIDKKTGDIIGYTNANALPWTIC
jgi:hypothetical protein